MVVCCGSLVIIAAFIVFFGVVLSSGLGLRFSGLDVCVVIFGVLYRFF